MKWVFTEIIDLKQTRFRLKNSDKPRLPLQYVS